jgi:hypothetical protein
MATWDKDNHPLFEEKKLSREVPIFMPIMEGNEQPLLIEFQMKLPPITPYFEALSTTQNECKRV